MVKSRFSTPIYGRPTRAPRPNVHIWPPLILQKASKSALFNGEVEGRARRRLEDPALRGCRPCACLRDDLQTGYHAAKALGSSRLRISGETTCRCYTQVPFEPHSNSQLRSSADYSPMLRPRLQKVYSIIDLRPQPPSFRLVFLPPRGQPLPFGSPYSLFPIPHSLASFIPYPSSFPPFPGPFNAHIIL